MTVADNFNASLHKQGKQGCFVMESYFSWQSRQIKIEEYLLL